jgi:hypothetical protein
MDLTLRREERESPLEAGAAIAVGAPLGSGALAATAAPVEDPAVGAATTLVGDGHDPI